MEHSGAGELGVSTGSLDSIALGLGPLGGSGGHGEGQASFGQDFLRGQRLPSPGSGDEFDRSPVGSPPALRSSSAEIGVKPPAPEQLLVDPVVAPKPQSEVGHYLAPPPLRRPDPSSASSTPRDPNAFESQTHLQPRTNLASQAILQATVPSSSVPQTQTPAGGAGDGTHGQVAHAFGVPAPSAEMYPAGQQAQIAGRGTSTEQQVLLDSWQKTRDSMWQAVATPPMVSPHARQFVAPGMLAPQPLNMISAYGPTPGMYMPQVGYLQQVAPMASPFPSTMPSVSPQSAAVPAPAEAPPEEPTSNPVHSVPAPQVAVEPAFSMGPENSHRVFENNLQTLRRHLVPELRARRQDLHGSLQFTDSQISEVRQRCAEAQREGQADFEALQAHLRSVEHLKMAVLNRERDERLRLVDGIDDVLKRVEVAAAGSHNPEVVAAFVRDFPELQANAQSLSSRSSALPQVEVSMGDIPYEARAKSDKLRKFAVMSRLQQAKDVCLWRMEEQRRQLAGELLEASTYLQHLEMLLERYAEEFAYVCYFCAERFGAGAANTRCLYNNQSPRAIPASNVDPRVPAHIWGIGTHFWVPCGQCPAPKSGMEFSVGADNPRIRAGIDDHVDGISGYSGPPSRHSTPPRLAPWWDTARDAPHLSGMYSHSNGGQFPGPVWSSGVAPPVRSTQSWSAGIAPTSHTAPPWSAGFAPLGGHSPQSAPDVLLSKIAQACDRNGTDIRSAFRAFDANGDGFVSPLEFRHALTQLKTGASDEEIERLVSRLDTNLDGMVSYEEFLAGHFRVARDPRVANVGEAFVEHYASRDAAAHSLWQRVERAFRNRGVHLRQVFALFDADGDGIISQHELQEAFRSMHLGLSESDIERLMRDVDVNADGRVSIQEFMSRLRAP